MFRHVPPRAPKTPRHPKTNPNPNPTPYTLTKQPYWTKNGVDDGFNDPAGRSFIRAWDQNSNNLMINGYNGVWTFDHDDCSQMVRDENNFMAWGGCKNFLGNHKACSSNVILYPGVGGRSAGDRRCQTDDNGARKRARRAAPRAHGGLRILLRNIFFCLIYPFHATADTNSLLQVFLLYSSTTTTSAPRQMAASTPLRTAMQRPTILIQRAITHRTTRSTWTRALASNRTARGPSVLQSGRISGRTREAPQQQRRQ
jgi:hypothetical protein